MLHDRLAFGDGDPGGTIVLSSNSRVGSFAQQQAVKGLSSPGMSNSQAKDLGQKGGFSGTDVQPAGLGLRKVLGRRSKILPMALLRFTRGQRKYAAATRPTSRKNRPLGILCRMEGFRKQAYIVTDMQMIVISEAWNNRCSSGLEWQAM